MTTNNLGEFTPLEIKGRPDVSSGLPLTGFTLFRKKGPVVGLDIDQEYITVVGLKKSPTGLKLINIASCPTPPKSIENGLIVNPKEISKAIKSLFTPLEVRQGGLLTGFATKQINSRSVITALWGPRVLIHLTKVPPMSKAEMKEALKAEIDHYLVFAGAETVSDMCRLKEVTEQGAQKVRVLMGVAEKEMVNSYVRVIKDAGLDLAAVDIGPLAVARALYSNYLKTPPNEAIILAAIEYQNTTLSILKAGILVYSRTIDLGSKDMVITDRFIDRLASELGAVVDYGQSEVGEVKKIVLAGSLEKIENLDEELGKRFEGIQIQMANPLKDVQYDKEGLSGEQRLPLTSFTRAIGLAIRGAGIKEYPFNIDLLPLEEIRIKEFKKQILQFFIALGGVIILLLITLLALRLWISPLAFKASILQQEMEKSSLILRELLEIEKSTKLHLDEWVKQKDIIYDTRKVRWDEILGEIKTIIPKKVRLRELGNEEDGVVFIGETESQAAVFNFVKSLVESPYFKEVNLHTTEDKEKHPVRAEISNGIYAEFNITCRLDMGEQE